MNTRRGFLGKLAGLWGVGAAIKAETPTDLPVASKPITPLDEAAIKAGWTRCEATIVRTGATNPDPLYVLCRRTTKHP